MRDATGKVFSLASRNLSFHTASAGNVAATANGAASLPHARMSQMDSKLSNDGFEQEH
jgi:hypothetical protein